MKELCTRRDEDNFLRSRPRTIDGAQIVSENERDVDNCVVTFQTESILQRFMIRFESLTIDCNDNLIIYDGAHAIGRAIVSLNHDLKVLSKSRRIRLLNYIIST